MTLQEKKEYLDLYLIQQAKISRLQFLMEQNPEAVDLYREQIASARQLRRKIEYEIDAVDGGKLSEILCQKYLCGKSLDVTAARLNYSKRHVERLYKEAMEKFNAS